MTAETKEDQRSDRRDVGSPLCRRLSGLSDTERESLRYAPESVLGPFEEFSPDDRSALLRAIEAYDQMSVKGHELGIWYQLWLRFLWWIKDTLKASGATHFSVFRLLYDLIEVAAYSFRRGPAYLIRRLYLESNKLRARLSMLGGQGDCAAWLARQAISPHALAVNYARPIDQQPEYRGYWHDRESHTTVGCVIGLDLIPADDGFYYLESNLDLAQRPERSALYERDPAVVNLLKHAASLDYGHIVLLDNNSSGIDPKMAREYLEEAAAAGIELTIVDRANVPFSPYDRSYGLPTIRDDSTLVVRYKSYPVSLDNLLNDKLAALRALQAYEANVEDPHLRIPRSSERPLIRSTDPDVPFPNVVLKVSELDQARGVYFAKAKSPEHAEDLLIQAQGERSTSSLQVRLLRRVVDFRTVYQEFIPPNLLSDRQPYIVRAHVLLSPTGIELLSAHRVVSSREVPEYLDYGIVGDPGPYLVNFSAQSRYTTVPNEEMSRVQRSSVSIARGFAWVIDQTFHTQPDPSA